MVRFVWCGLVVSACDAGGESCPDPIVERTLDQGSERLGTSVSAGPDADGDGHPDVVVGDPSPAQTGALGVVSLVSGATGRVIRTWQAEEGGDGFGTRVSLGPDADGDGLADVLIAAPYHATYRGRVELRSGATGAMLAAWDGEFWLGQDVSLGPDLDGDGLGDVVLSDRLEYDEEIDKDVISVRRGRVYIHAGTGAALATIDAPDRDSRFGDNAQLGLDVNGDGAGDILVTDSSGGGTQRGIVRLYSGATGTLLRTWEPDASTYYFGTAAALGPDTDGDSVPDIAIAMTDTTSIEERVELHSGAGDAVLHTWRDLNWHPLWGRRLVVAPDLDGDGRGDVVIGADMKLADANEPAITTFVYSGATGAELASWSHAEHRYFTTQAVAAAPDVAGCGALVAIGVGETDANNPVAGRVELRRLVP